MSEETDLMDPANNDLIPSDDRPGPAPPELSPEYEERQQPADSNGVGPDALSEALSRSKADPCGFEGGLRLQRSGGPGLHVFKGDRIIRDLLDLDTAEIRTIKKYLELSR